MFLKPSVINTPSKMKKLPGILIVLLMAGQWAMAQSTVTTFVFVRHAEKADDGTKDPDLSPEGRKRADNLANLLASQKFAALLSTGYKRTQQTAAPLSAKLGIPVATYRNLTDAGLDSLATKYKGETILVVGHSNTVPVMANHLLNEQRYKPFQDSEYGNLLVISVAKPGEAGKLLHLSY